MIESLVWRRANVAKLRAHGISPREVQELVDLDAYTVDVHPDYPDQVRVTGPTAAGRWLTIAMEAAAGHGAGAYRPVTGWGATERELADYREKMR